MPRKVPIGRSRGMCCRIPWTGRSVPPILLCGNGRSHIRAVHEIERARAAISPDSAACNSERSA